RRRALREALTVLKDRERRIFEARRLADDPPSLDELGDELGLSPERVRQIEMSAFAKVQAAVKARVAASEARGRRASVADRVPRLPASLQVSQIARYRGEGAREPAMA